MSLSAREREDDSYRSYYEAWAAILEMSIRSGEMPPDPNKPEHARWAAEGPVRSSQLETVRSERRRTT